jgi:hypothetical protein
MNWFRGCDSVKRKEHIWPGRRRSAKSCHLALIVEIIGKPADALAHMGAFGQSYWPDNLTSR